MRICLLNPTVLLRRPIVELAQRLATNGHTVTILTAGQAHPQEARMADEQMRQQNAVRVIAMPVYEIKAILWSVPRQLTFARRVQAIMVEHDIIQIWAPFYPIAWAAVWPRMATAKRVITFDTFPGYSFDLSEPFNGAIRQYTRWMVPRFNQADAITLYSRQLLPYAQQLGLDQRKLVVVPTGITIKKPTPVDKRAIRQRLHFPTERQLILFVGLLNDRKGVDTLLKVARLLKQQRHDFIFILVGAGPQLSKYQALITSWQLQDVVRLVGAQTNMSDWYQAADIFFLPSRGEGLPGVVMEAMTYGLPVVASNIPCLPDLVSSGHTGRLVPPEEVVGFVKALTACLASTVVCESLGQAGRLKIKTYNWDRIVPQYESLYARLVV